MAETAEALGLREPDTDYATPPPPLLHPATTTVFVAFGALVVGFLLSAGVTAGRSAAAVQDARKEQLIALVRVRESRATALSEQLDDLRAQVQEAQSAATDRRPAFERQLDDAAAAAGMTELRGPGVRATFADGEGDCPTGQPHDCEIQDVDLQLAVNELFALGAEGVAVNGQRVIATTAVRNAGGAILVNYRVLATPYEVQAIGDPERLAEGLAGSDLGRDFAVWRDAYDLGFAIERSEALSLPAHSGAVQLRVAQPAEAG